MEGYRRTTSESRSRPTVTGFGKVDFRICTQCRLTSRRSQPPSCPAIASERRLMALAVPLSRFTSRVGGGSAFYVRRTHTSNNKRKDKHMFITTTFTIEGYHITEYKGLVRGIIVRAPTIAQGIVGGLKGIIGGRIGDVVSLDCECSSN